MSLRDTVVELIRPTPLYGIVRRIRDAIAVRRWRRAGRPVPPPHAIKVAAVREYADRFGARVLIETGTFRGAMMSAQRKYFRDLYTIEIDPALHAAAVKLFRRSPNVHLILGDSAAALPRVLSGINERCVFWLDGHYSGGVTGRGALDSPIAQELSHIWKHPVRDHVIIIDDARDFTGRDGYPTIDELRAVVHHHRPGWICEVADDLIRIHAAR